MPFGIERIEFFKRYAIYIGICQLDFPQDFKHLMCVLLCAYFDKFALKGCSSGSNEKGHLMNPDVYRIEQAGPQPHNRSNLCRKGNDTSEFKCFVQRWPHQNSFLHSELKDMPTNSTRAFPSLPTTSALQSASCS